MFNICRVNRGVFVVSEQTVLEHIPGETPGTGSVEIQWHLRLTLLNECYER